MPVHFHVGGELLIALSVVRQALRAHGARDSLDVVGRSSHEQQLARTGRHVHLGNAPGP